MLYSLFALVQGSTECAIQIDAGSSGTKFYISSWTAADGAWKKSVPPDFTIKKSIEVQPGLQYYLDADKAKSMEQDFKDQLTVLEEETTTKDCQSPAEIPMWLMATAGLRILPSEKVENILSEIGKLFETSPFAWKYGIVLSGEEEAVYCWIGQVYFLNLLGAENTKVGVMEIGGQSLQIAFMPTNGIIMDNSYDVKLFGSSYRLYAKSWNGLGINSIMENLGTILTNAILTPTEYKYLNGNAHPCLKEGWKNVKSNLSSKINWSGDGNYDKEKCDGLITHFITSFSPGKCYYDKCRFSNTYVSDMNELNFYAFSSFREMVEILQKFYYIHSDPPRIELSLLSQAIEKFCELPLENMKEMPGYKQETDTGKCYYVKIVFQILSQLGFTHIQFEDGTVKKTFDLGSNVIPAVYLSLEKDKEAYGSWRVGALITNMYNAVNTPAVDDLKREDKK